PLEKLAERGAIRLDTTNLLREHLGTAGGVKLSILRSQGLPVGAHSGIAVDSHVPLCVQRRLACSAGDRPAGARVRSPVVWIAGWRGTKTFKPIDKVSPGEITSHRAVTTVNAQVASKMSESEGRACN